MILRRIYLLFLFKIEYGGIDFYNLDLQQTLNWWDSLGCTVFMVIVPVGCILMKRNITKSINILKYN